MIQASIYGCSGRDPKLTTRNAGKAMCSAQIAVDVGKDPGTETLWVMVMVMAFGQRRVQFEALARRAEWILVADAFVLLCYQL